MYHLFKVRYIVHILLSWTLRLFQWHWDYRANDETMETVTHLRGGGINARMHNVNRGSLTRYVKLGVAHAPGMPRTFSLPLRVSDPDMHHGTCVTRVLWCMPGSSTSGVIWSRWRVKRARHSRHMRYPHFYVFGKRPMCMIWAALCKTYRNFVDMPFLLRLSSFLESLMPNTAIIKTYQTCVNFHVVLWIPHISGNVQSEYTWLNELFSVIELYLVEI